MKKIISVVLVLVMAASMIPAAHADGIDIYFKSLLVATKEQGNDSMQISYKRAGNLVFLNYSVGNMQTVGDLANGGDKDYCELWNSVVDAMVEELQAILDEFRSYGLDCCVIYTLMSDEDPDVVLISVTEGEIIYDYVNGTHPIIQVEG